MRNLNEYPITTEEAYAVGQKVIDDLLNIRPLLIGDMRPICLQSLLDFAKSNPKDFEKFLENYLQ